jgi:hypothetical protein
MPDLRPAVEHEALARLGAAEADADKLATELVLAAWRPRGKPACKSPC